MLSFLAAWSLLEITLFTIFLLALGWGTSKDRSGRPDDTSFKWIILGVGFVGYLIYYAITHDDWFPPLFDASFWTERSTWITLGKYVGAGLLYALLELVLAVRNEQKQIKARWTKFLKEHPEIAGYVAGNTPENDMVATHLSTKVRNFANDWGRHNSFVSLFLHELERTPQPSLQMHQVRAHVFSWTVLWPGYAVSLAFGRLLDSLIDALNRAYKAMGGVIVRILFRNTFKSN
jgi:hypothetical protein